LLVGWLVCNVTRNIVKCFSFYVSKMLLTILQHVSFQDFFRAFGGILAAFRDPNLGFTSLSIAFSKECSIGARWRSYAKLRTSLYVLGLVPPFLLPRRVSSSHDCIVTCNQPKLLQYTIIVINSYFTVNQPP
jgi:hypothetical protein